MANTKIPDLTLSDTLNAQRLKFNQLLDSVGDVSALTTTAGPVANAINELDAELGTISAGAMGTTASTVSGAIAELDGRLDSINNTQLTSPEIRITGSSVSSVAGKLEVGDSADFASNMSVQGNLAVGGNTTMSGTLTVDGQVTFKAGSDNNIALGDAATDTITLTGEVNSNVIPDAGNTYDLGSDGQQWRDLFVDGTANIDNVAADSATIANNMSVGGTLDVTGDTTLSNTITVQDSAYITGNLNLGSNLDVAGNVDVTGTFKSKSALTVEDSAYITGNLDVGGDTTFANTITVQDSAYVTGNLDIGGSLDVATAATLASAKVSDLTSGRVVIAGTGGELADDSKFTWDTTNGLKITEALTVEDSAYITGNLDVGSALSAGTTTLGSTTLSSAKVSDLTNDRLVVVGTAGELEDDGNLTWNGTLLDVTGGLSVSQGFTVGGTFTTTGVTRNAASYVIVNDQVAVANGNRAGLAVDRPSSDSAVIQWNELGDYWEAGTTAGVKRLALQNDSAGFGNVYVAGNLTVNGTTTTVNSTTVEIGDNIILLNDSLAGSAIANAVDAGIEIERGTSTNVQLLWDESEDYWVAAEDGSNTLGRIATSGWLDATAPISYNSTTGNFSHDNATRTNISTSESPGSGGTFDVVDSIQSNVTGHVTQVATRTITLPTNYSSWTLQGDGGSNQTINSGNTVDIAGGTYITTAAGATDTLTVSHDNTGRTNISTSESVAHSGSFDVVDSIQSNATGHVTQVATRTITLPAGAVPNNATITISGGTDLETGGDFTTDQSGNETITLDHSDVTRTNVSTSESPGYGGAFDVIDSIQSSSTGHITRVATRTITLPASDNTDTTYSAGTDLDLSGTTFSIEEELNGVNKIMAPTNDSLTIASHAFLKLYSGHNGTPQGYNTMQLYAANYQFSFGLDATNQFGIYEDATLGGPRLTTTQSGDNLAIDADVDVHLRAGVDIILDHGPSDSVFIKEDTGSEFIEIITSDTNGYQFIKASDTLLLSGTTIGTGADRVLVQSVSQYGGLRIGGAGDTALTGSGYENLELSDRFISFGVYDTNSGSGVFTPARTNTNSVTNGSFAMNFKHGTGTVMEWYADKDPFSSTADYENICSWTVDGDFTAAGQIAAYSDARLKENIETVDNALDKVSSMRGVTFTRNDKVDKEKKYVGVIAQEMQEVVPEVVNHNEEKDVYTVDYDGLVGVLIEAIKDLKNEVDELKGKCKCH